MQRCQEREAREEGAQENTALLSKGASLPFLSLQALLFVTGHGLKPWKTDYTQEQGFNFQLPPPTLAQAGESEHQQSDAGQQCHSNWRCNRSAGFNEQEGSSTAGTGSIPLYSVQREASRKAASSQPTPPPSHLYGGSSCLASVPQGKGRGHPVRASEPGRLRAASLTCRTSEGGTTSLVLR